SSGLNLNLAEREPEGFEQSLTLLVVVRCCDDRDVHPPGGLHHVEVDLRKDQLLGSTHAVIAPAVERPWVQTPKVPHTRDGDGQKTVKELPHFGSAQGHRDPDSHTFTEFEVGDRLASLVDPGLLPGDQTELFESLVDGLLVVDRLTQTHVE